MQLTDGAPGGESEPHAPSLNNRLNWLRAGVLGANDGIVSTAGLVVGVAAATTERSAIFTAGFAGLVAGADAVVAVVAVVVVVRAPLAVGGARVPANHIGRRCSLLFSWSSSVRSRFSRSVPFLLP